MSASWRTRAESAYWLSGGQERDERLERAGETDEEGDL